MLPLAIVSIVGATMFFFYIAYIEVTQNAPQYHGFPSQVADPLRKAIYFTDVHFNPVKALHHYKTALVAARDAGIHRFSDEYTGIELKVAEMLEQSGNPKQAAKILERLRGDIIKWVVSRRKDAAAKKETVENHLKKVAEEEAKKQEAEAGTYPMQPTLDTNNPRVLKSFEDMKEWEEWVARQQAKNMKKAVGISVKLNDLYRGNEIQDTKKAQLNIEIAAGYALRELDYRERSGLPVDGGFADDEDEPVPWLTRAEAGAVIMDLAQWYMASRQEDGAVRTMMHSLELFREEGPQSTCIQIHIVANIAATMGTSSTKPLHGPDTEGLREKVASEARRWAEKGLQMCQTLPQNQKDDDDCNMNCILLKNTLGAIAGAHGNLEEAEKWYKEALQDSRDQFRGRENDPRAKMILPDLEASVRDLSKK